MRDKNKSLQGAPQLPKSVEQEWKWQKHKEGDISQVY